MPEDITQPPQDPTTLADTEEYVHRLQLIR